jgi:signal transduction histidine kinase
VTRSGPPYRVALRLYVVFSLLMAVSAAASGLLLLYLARPFISEVGGAHVGQATALLFTGAGVAGATAAVAGLVVGLRLAGRIRVIVKKAEALAPPATGGPDRRVRDELGALDAAVGRLTLSMDQFVRDSDILARLPEGMLLLLPTGELVSFNTTAEIILGVSLERWRRVSILSPAGVFPADRGNESLAALLGDATAGQRSIQSREVSVTTPVATQALSLEMTVQHREWGTDGMALVLLFHDASEKQRIRDEIRRADQLALLGGMAARVAHEIRTPLSTIRGLLELLEGDLPPDHPNRGYIERIIQAVDRQDRLVENLLTLTSAELDAARPVSIPSLIKDVLGVLPHDGRVRVSPPAGDLPAVWGDAFRLSEVFANLIQNAVEATPGDGIVDVRIEPRDGASVRVSVHNTGAGIPVELRERIFQPFFTTKARGTGLGLAIARQIVDAHHGRLGVTSDGLSETTFVVDLPVAAPAGAARPS